MNRRPWPLVILALLHMIAPLWSILLSAKLLHVSPWQYVQLITYQPLPQILEFFFLFPLAGIAIYLMKSWSYLVFISVILFSFYRHYQNWAEVPNLVTIPMVTIAFIVNLSIVTYFLIPAVRSTYFNRRLRWWEARIRYFVQLSTKVFLSSTDQVITGEVTDISDGGVFLETNTDIVLGEMIHLEFQYESRTYKLPGQVIYHRKEGRVGYGVEFKGLLLKDKVSLKKLIFTLKKNKHEQVRKVSPWLEDFKHWVTTLFTTGKGIVPHKPQAPAPAKKKER